MRIAARLGAFAVAGLLIITFGGVAKATSYAGLVIRHGDGSVVTRCVSFDEASISGIDLLYRSGLSIDAPTSGYGASVYGIDGEGTAEDWSSGRASWSYWHLRGAWVFSPVGASSYSVKQGDVEGWSWGPQTGPTAPPAYSFDELYRDTFGDPAPASPSAGASQPATDAATSPTSPGIASPGATAGSNVSGANSVGTTANPSLTSGNKTATATAAAVRRPVGKKGQQDNNFWNYASFGVLLAGLSAAFVYYQLKNRKPTKP